ncbi:tetratricopeptide repeat protein [Micromonospora sp. NBC_01412]|uniref:tetratricopeptide repeat protein n=1 Tax=Micromonospora sp. NBC_01412 TaxID=2903590 RepID=UPI00324CF7F3
MAFLVVDVTVGWFRGMTTWARRSPRLAAIAAAALGTTEAWAEQHSTELDDGTVHVWLPGRGGNHLVIGPDGGMYVDTAAVDVATLRDRFRQGQRTYEQQIAALRGINSAVAIRELFLKTVRGVENLEPFYSVPAQHDLEAIVGRELEETGAFEIMERLQGDPPGACLLVAFDRATGPGHYVLGYNMDGTAVTIDPLYREPMPFPPPGAIDAVRWFADGAPMRPHYPMGIVPSDPVVVAAGILGIDEAAARTHAHRYDDGLVHVWTPGRGGAQVIVGPGGQALAVESSFTAAELLAMYGTGKRAASTVRVNHAASAVSSTIDMLCGGELTPAQRTGPNQAELEAKIGRPLQQTTAEEIAERLTTQGEYRLVGVDRAQGPGHWYIAINMGEQGIQALDPIANTKHAWPPPNADAIRWWADGDPLRPAPPAPASGAAGGKTEMVDVEATSAAGTRFWARVPEAYREFGTQFAKSAADLDAKWHKHGQVYFEGFWKMSIHNDGSGGFRLAAWNIDPARERAEWDLTPALEVMAQQRRATVFAKVRRESVRYERNFTVQRGTLDATVIHLVRSTPADANDSGWYIGTSATRSADAEVMTGKELHRRNPYLARFFGFPAGWYGTWDGRRMATLVNPEGETVWDAAAHDAAEAAKAAKAAAPVAPLAEPLAAPPDPRQSGGVAYRTAKALLADRHGFTPTGSPPAGGSVPDLLTEAGIGLYEAFKRAEHLVGLLPTDAVEVMTRALAGAGTGAAYVCLGDWLRKPFVGTPQPAAALEKYRAADRLGHRPGSIAWLTWSYFENAPDAEQVAARLDELIGEAEGDGDGRLHLLRGWMRGKGYGYQKDLAAALVDHQFAAARRNADALFELHVIHATGLGVPEDRQRANEYLTQAAQHGHTRALHNLAALHATGDGVPRDPSRAVELYVDAAERGHGRAAFMAAMMFATGEAGAADVARARTLFTTAQELGHPVADLLPQLPPEARRVAHEALRG